MNNKVVEQLKEICRVYQHLDLQTGHSFLYILDKVLRLFKEGRVATTYHDIKSVSFIDVHI